MQIVFFQCFTVGKNVKKIFILIVPRLCQFALVKRQVVIIRNKTTNKHWKKRISVLGKALI